MTTWDLRRLQQFLDKHPPGAVYLLFGEETYLVNEALQLIRQKTLQEGAIDFNYDNLFTTEASASQVMDIVETLPVMCERRLVVYRGVHQLKDRDWEKLIPAFDNPIDTTTFVLVADKIDKRKKYIKKLAEKGTLVELKKPYDNQVAAWIDYIAFQNGIKLDREGIPLVYQMVGNNLTEISSEMKKLKQYLGDRENPSTEEILKVVSQVKIDSVFDLTNAIGRKDRASALTHLANLLEHGENEFAVLSLVLRHIRILAQIKEGSRQGLTGAKLGAKAGVSNFFLKQYVEQARHWNEEKIVATIEALHQTDKALKSSPVSSHIWLDNFIVQTCQ